MLRPQRRRHPHGLIPVEGLVPAPGCPEKTLADLVLGLAMDQRAFGPRQLMVAFGAEDGRFLGLHYCTRTDPPDDALRACLWHFDHNGRGGEQRAAAVVLCDEAVVVGPPAASFTAQFEAGRLLAAEHDVHLVDWVACDDEQFRFARMRPSGPTPEPGWWDVPLAS
ncbi:hypothetical protein AWH69_02985 [Janibacter melonis]|uniref:Uncharacterized protein n=1 Tax=Janibacter melonis TaxID=262209 RepID=A0A176QGC6_9MICO|nr:hypothetical protein [Janibacter melonis]OAB88763.1 hypothetical protein AWH69_02985 [Janibacter melonis]